ncbi:MAG: 4-(cytidine 5'-diphospho)-2-C-methyl-D-erythritol kinase [Planctomycetaceae bacterium]|nr:4-(cytidine 5'-diphospho)-2-C-methyl-D-erythritol kinase [Planctomycetaceae bacterium]
MLYRRTSSGWTAQAPAKVNLFLRVIARRPDGFHELETVMTKLDLADDLHFEPLDGDAIDLQVKLAYPRSLGAMEIPASADNLVYKAAELLRRETGTQHGVRITLTKHVPAAAGLGGGSSDAATTLIVLNEMWQLRFSNADLCSLAAQLGSDVPFFVANDACALCTGRGEKMEPVPVRRCLHLVLAKPQSGLSTAAVYKGCRPEPDGPFAEEWLRKWQDGAVIHAARGLHNSLQTPAEILNADVTRLKERFSQFPVCGHQLTGSGSAYFGICRDARQARRLAANLRQQGIPWAVAVTTRA